MKRLLLGLALASLAAAPAAAQDRVCNLTRSNRISQEEMSGVTTFYDAFEFRCNDGTVLRANSGTLNSFARELVLVGDVFFEDPDQTLTADNATYNSGTGRLYATGNVVFTNRTEGSKIRGPELEYYRVMPDRPEAVVSAWQRPHLTLQPKEGGDDAEPLELDGDRVQIFGQDRLIANGNVVITRTDLNATAEEAEYDAESGSLELRRDARIVSDDYTLVGQVVQARLRDNVLEHVHARTEAAVTGSELNVTSPDLQLFFENELLQRAVARTPERGSDDPGQRAVAVSRNFRLTADSIDAVLPSQKLEQVVAIGRARGEAIDTAAVDSAAVIDSSVVEDADADSAAAAPTAGDTIAGDSVPQAARELIDRDWILGDTIIGFFEPPADTAGASDTTVVLRRIVSRGDARSLYRIAQEDAEPGARRGVNFLAGDAIELTFEAGELHVADVTGLRRGIYLDPAPPAATAAPTPAPARPSGGGR